MANKRLFLILPLILTLALAACAGPSSEQIPTITPRIYVPASPTETHTPPPATPTPTPAPSLTPNKIFDGNMEKGDYLIYLPETGPENHLFFYDPATDIHIPILPDWKIRYFAVSTKDQIAFSVLDESTETYDTYILDYPYWENTPLNITNTPETNELAHSWSPDGNYLVLEIYSDETDTLTVWDGNQFYQIHETGNGRRFGFYETDWSKSGNFVFADYDSPQTSHETTEIYVWDGNPSHTTFSITQNIKNETRHAAWSPNGQLAFQIYYGNQNYSIMVWDGNFAAQNLIDDPAFTEISNGLIQLYSSPVWTNEGILAFESNGSMYQWDGEVIARMKNVWRFGWAVQTWSDSGYWASVNAFWDNPNLLYIHDQNNKVVLKTEGRYTPAWSPEGNLAFCVDEISGGFSINIWDGTNLIKAIQYDGYIFAKWRNGESIYCSNG